LFVSAKFIEMKLLTVRATIEASLNKVWNCWTEAAQVQHWNFASSDWHCPATSNDLIVGGEFHYTMAAKDNSEQFDFWGTYQAIEINKSLEIVLGDGRIMKVLFDETQEGIVVTEQFEPENQNPIDLQQAGWQMILDNFKNYVEQNR
jgi:uncharacterized protein YndB with AHSA1/START domain